MLNILLVNTQTFFIYFFSSTNWDAYKVEINVDLVEPIILQGDYKINGKVLILPITGLGKCKLTLSM